MILISRFSIWFLSFKWISMLKLILFFLFYKSMLNASTTQYFLNWAKYQVNNKICDITSTWSFATKTFHFTSNNQLQIIKTFLNSLKFTDESSGEKITITWDRATFQTVFAGATAETRLSQGVRGGSTAATKRKRRRWRKFLGTICRKITQVEFLPALNSFTCEKAI